MTDIRLLPATVESLLALQLDPPASSEVRCPTLPEFPESIGFSIDRLRVHPDETDWWMHSFLAEDRLMEVTGDSC